MPDNNVVAGYGRLHSYCHQAYLAFEMHGTDYEDFSSFEGAAKALHNGKARWAVLPLRDDKGNAIPGIDSLIGDFKKLDERELLVEFALFGNDGATIDRIKSVTSHPIALDQCMNFIRRRGWKTILRSDTSDAIIDVMAQNDPTLAAIGPHKLGMHAGAHLLAYPINDRENVYVFGVFEKSA